MGRLGSGSHVVGRLGLGMLVSAGALKMQDQKMQDQIAISYATLLRFSC